jgi:ParB/RepB/Spo0J family partition protein
MSNRKTKAAPAVDDDYETQADRELDEELDETLSVGDDDDDLWDGDEDDESGVAELEDQFDKALTERQCVYCGCTESQACQLEDGPCSWSADADSADDVCSNPACLVQHRRAKQPVREYFSPVALQQLPAKMRDRPLSAQSNQWIVSTIGRLVEAQPSADSPMLSDLDALLDAASVRDIASTISDHTLDEARRLLAQRAAAAPTEEQVHEEPIGIAAKLPGEPAVMAVVVELALSDVVPDPDQPRDEGADDEIGQEIHASTILPPIEVRAHPRTGWTVEPGRGRGFALVSPTGNTFDTYKTEEDARAQLATLKPHYMIVDGERRYRGSVKAGRTTIRAIVNEQPMDAGDLLLRQSALNTGKRLKPLEEARTWKRIIDAKGWNASQLADYLKKPRSTVADRLAILEAPEIFQPLFLDGTLSAAAAPIVRKFAGVPKSILERGLQAAQEDWTWEDALADDKSVPVKIVEDLLDDFILGQELREIEKDLREEYTGEVVRVGKKDYAVNIDAYDKLVEKREAAKAKASPGASPSKPARREPSKYELEQRKQIKAAKKKSELRRAQFVAISKKLPTVISDAWSMPVVKWLLREMTNDTLRNASKALGLEPAKGKHGLFDFATAILEHAEDLPVPQRTKLVIQLLLANDLYVSPHSSGGAERLSVAAKLANVDLNKVKLPDPDEPKKPAAKKAPAAKAKKPGKAKASR